MEREIVCDHLKQAVEEDLGVKIEKLVIDKNNIIQAVYYDHIAFDGMLARRQHRYSVGEVQASWGGAWVNNE